MNPIQETNLQRNEETRFARDEETRFARDEETRFARDEETRFTRVEDTRFTRNEDNHEIVELRQEVEKLKRRLEWMRQKELEKEHEKLKQKMIERYEKKRAEARRSRQTFLHHSRSRSSGNSPSHYRYRERSSPNASTSDTMFKKFDESTSKAVPLRKGSEGRPIDTTELRNIKIEIRRNIPARRSVGSLQGNIFNPEI